MEYNKPGYMGSNLTGGKVVHLTVDRLTDATVTERPTIDLTPTAGVEGVVLDEEGRPIQGVLVESQYGNGPSTTDEAGRLGASNVAAPIAFGSMFC